MLALRIEELQPHAEPAGRAAATLQLPFALKEPQPGGGYMRCSPRAREEDLNERVDKEMAVAHRDRHRRPGDGNCLRDSYAANTAAGHSCGRTQGAIRIDLAYALIFTPSGIFFRRLKLAGITIRRCFRSSNIRKRPPPCIDTVAAPLYSTRSKHETVFHTMKQPGVIDAR